VQSTLCGSRALGEKGGEASSVVRGGLKKKGSWPAWGWLTRGRGRRWKKRVVCSQGSTKNVGKKKFSTEQASVCLKKKTRKIKTIRASQKKTSSSQVLHWRGGTQPTLGNTKKKEEASNLRGQGVLVQRNVLGHFSKISLGILNVKGGVLLPDLQPGIEKESLLKRNKVKGKKGSHNTTKKRTVASERAFSKGPASLGRR